MSDRRDHHEASGSRLPPQPGPFPPPGERIPDEVIDRFFDRELDSGEKAALFAQLRAQPDRAREIVQTQQMLAELDDPMIGPDLVGVVLDRVHRRRAFLPSGWRRVVTTGRALVAVGVLALIAGVALIERYAPALTMNDRPTPVTRVVTSGPQTVVQDMGTIVSAGRSVFEERPSDRRPAPIDGVIAAAWASQGGPHEMVVAGEPRRTSVGGVVRFGDDHAVRVWTVDASAMALDLQGSGAWAPASPVAFAGAPDAIGAGGVRYTASTSMSVNLVGVGRTGAFTAYTVDADPFTMRLRSVPSYSIDLSIVRFAPTSSRDVEEDVGIGGIRFVRFTRDSRDRAPRR